LIAFDAVGLVFWQPLTETGDARWRRMVKVGAVPAGALAILWGFCFFRYAETSTGQEVFNRALADKIRDVNTPFYHSVLAGMVATHIVPRAYLWGFADTVHAGMEGRPDPQLIFGRLYVRRGPKHFFPAMIAIKLPIGLSVLSLLGLILFFARRLLEEWNFPAGVILAAALLFLLVLAMGATYAGIRHALPVVALLSIFAGFFVGGRTYLVGRMTGRSITYYCAAISPSVKCAVPIVSSKTRRDRPCPAGKGEE
jgi:hypothetical protein